MALSTVSGILTRAGLGKLGRLGLEPAQRYERERPGELLHVDVKKLGRIEGGAGKRMRDRPKRHSHTTRTDRAGTSVLHAIACRALGIRHLRTRPHRPQTNGKAERFIRTLLQGWAYGAVYGSSTQRTRALAGWMHFYNHQRPTAPSTTSRPSPAYARRTTCSGPTPRADLERASGRAHCSLAAASVAAVSRVIASKSLAAINAGATIQLPPMAAT
jgi:Integrase core domain